MATEPPEEEVQNLINIAGVTRHQAVTLLRASKNYNNDSARAVNEYFDNPEAALRPQQDTHTWSEADNFPTHKIERDETNAGGVQVGLSRPPSRTSYREEGERLPIDLAKEHAGAQLDKPLTLDEQEEANFQAALQASRVNLPPGQETGVTATGQQFGPAHGSYHDAHNWAMTTYDPRAQEVAEHPPPQARQRKPEEPAFLRYSERAGYLPALLTIYHSIPLAREALLLPTVRAASYGYDPEWWAGARIQLSRVISYDDAFVDHGDSGDFIHETQRLMAFLDATDRSYGSADTLAEFDCLRGWNADSEVKRFLQTWVPSAMALSPDDQLTQIFSSLAVKSLPEGVTTKDFKCLEPNPRRFDSTLYDTLDTAIWADEPNMTLSDVWFEQVAEIFTIRLYDSNLDPTMRRQITGVEIPATWYPDRYLEDYKQVSQAMRARKLELNAELFELQRLGSRCATQPGPNGPLGVRETLLAAASAAEIAVRDTTMTNGQHYDLQPVPPRSSQISAAEGRDCARELRQVVERIDQKLRSLDEQKERTLELYRRVAQQLTQPYEAPPDTLMHKYTLRGVSTKQHITYVLRPATQDLMDFEDADGGAQTNNGKWQWWRISSSHEDIQLPDTQPVLGPLTRSQVQAAEASTSNPSGPYSEWPRKPQQPMPDSDHRSGFSVRKISEFEVLKAAREESNSVLLVYANENAVNHTDPELTPELRAFVESDNQSFAAELRGEAGEELQQGPMTNENQRLVDDDDDDMVPMPTSPKRHTDGTTSPPKRYKSIDGRTGIATPPDDEPPPYTADDGIAVQEMQEKSIGSSPLTTARSNRIGQHAERMMARIEEAGEDEPSLEPT